MDISNYKVRCDCGTEAYKLPIELLYENRDFQCEKCAQRERALQTTLTNGRVGDLTLTEHTRLRRSAEKRGYAFEVSMEYLWNLFQEQKQICRKVLNHANQQPSQPLTKLEGSETNS